MIRLKVGLKPTKNAPVSLNYKYSLGVICNRFLEKKRKSNENNTKEKLDVVNYSQLFCTKYNIKGDKIVFYDQVSWYVTSPSYETILTIAQKLFDENFLVIGKEEFEIVGLELMETANVESSELPREPLELKVNRDLDIHEKINQYYILAEGEAIM